MKSTSETSESGRLPEGIGLAHLAGMAAARIALGATALLAPRAMARALFFPREQVTPSAVMLGRFYGVRNLVIGLLTLAAMRRPEKAKRMTAVNAAMDAADAGVIVVPLVRREGIDATAVSALGIASLMTLGWLRALFTWPKG